MELGTPQFWLAGLEIIVINILLSGDNAVVIALACRNLPHNQRRWGIVWGATGAIVLRIILTFFAVKLLALPYLKIVGGALLVWIGIKLIAEDEEEGHEVQASDRMLAAVKTVIVADLVMSIDNELAVAGAARGSLVLLIFGLVVSIPLVILGAQLIMKMIERVPILVLAGGGLLGYVAGEMVVQDPALEHRIAAGPHWLHWAIPLAGILLVIGTAKALERRRPAREVGPPGER
jgi:YjbE family integral membrane protein